MTEASRIINLVRQVIADSASVGIDVFDFITTNGVTKKLGLTSRTVRFYSDLGIARPLRRGSSRLYTPPQVRRLELARELRGIGLDVKTVLSTLDYLAGPDSDETKLAALGRQIAEHAGELTNREEELGRQKAMTRKLVRELGA